VESISGGTAKRRHRTANADRRMIDRPFKFDEIGYWSELKLEIVEKYGAAYTKAFANSPRLTSVRLKCKQTQLVTL
jgi:hypothetical protein